MHQFAFCYVISISIAYTTPLTQLAPLRQNCLGRSRFNSLFSTPLYDDSVEPEIVGINTSSSSNFVSSQSSGYKTTTLLFTALAIDTHKPHIRAVLLNNPTHLLPSTAPILAAIITWSLKSATINSNLHSDTYKGLNMAVTLYSLFSLFAHLANFPFLGASGAAVHVYAAVLSCYGWVIGAQGVNYVSDKFEWRLVRAELVNTIRRTIKTITTKPRNILSTFPYLLTFFFCSLGLIHEVIMIKTKCGGVRNQAFLAVKLWSIGRFILAGKVAICLKSATDRDRLDGTTFKRLHFGLGVMAVGAALAFKELGRRGSAITAAVVAVGFFKNGRMGDMFIESKNGMLAAYKEFIAN